LTVGFERRLLILRFQTVKSASRLSKKEAKVNKGTLFKETTGLVSKEKIDAPFQS